MTRCVAIWSIWLYDEAMSAAETTAPDSRTVKVQEAKTRLSELLREVEDGAEITISRGRTPVCLLYTSPSPRD